jgi:hypothetical protein
MAIFAFILFFFPVILLWAWIDERKDNRDNWS